MQSVHRAGLWKQQNKNHKHGRHKTKGELDKAAKGKVAARVSKHVKRELNRADRKNRLRQLRKNWREEILAKKRNIGGATTTPLLVAFVALDSNIYPTRAITLLSQAEENAVITHTKEGSMHIGFPRSKHRIMFVTPPVGDLFATLDTLKVANSVIFLLSAQNINGIEEMGEEMLTAAVNQGLPSASVSLLDLELIPIKKRNDVKQQIQKTMSRWIPDIKICALDAINDAQKLLRTIENQKLRPVAFRDNRPLILAEKVDYVKDEYSQFGTLKVSGFVRSKPLSVNGLVHISGWGDFQISQIDFELDPYSLKHSSDLEINASLKPDPQKQESLETENPVDPMEGEQTWPTPEELLEAETERKAKKLVKRVPKGTSDYQASWIPDIDAVEVADDRESDDGDEDLFMDAESEKYSSCENESTAGDDEELVTMSTTEEIGVRYDDKMDFDEEQEALDKLKEAKTDKQFPDEYDTPQDVAARIRFAKYRGLQSFRTSPWDPKENLPQDYARIFQFENFHRMRKRLLKDTDEDESHAMVGSYVTIHISKVPDFLVISRSIGHPLIVVGLLPHEQKMSLLNVVLKRPTNCSGSEIPIKSKEQLLFQCGCRRFIACPIFSQHTNGNKHKYERFFQPDATVVASMYAPITFPPCPVLAFKLTREGNQHFVGVGSVMSADPDRIVLKRIVLSGHPLRVYKRSAVIRFMFFNREDISWFKPVELRTKYGRRGHIKEPLGTHGHMKCVFDGQLKSQDTVLMNLYKRVYPKWTYENFMLSSCHNGDKESEMYICE